MPKLDWKIISGIVMLIIFGWGILTAVTKNEYTTENAKINNIKQTEAIDELRIVQANANNKINQSIAKNAQNIGLLSQTVNNLVQSLSKKPNNNTELSKLLAFYNENRTKDIETRYAQRIKDLEYNASQRKKCYYK